jgi:hypothetical protein
MISYAEPYREKLYANNHQSAHGSKHWYDSLGLFVVVLVVVLIVVLALSPFAPLRAQPTIPPPLPRLLLDTTRGIVGENMRIALRLSDVPNTGRILLAGTFTMSNPTVFFPRDLSAPAGATLLESSLVRRNDSTYSFSCSLQRSAANRDTLAYLDGEAFAASDTITAMKFTGLTVRVGTATTALVATPVATSATVITRTFGAAANNGDPNAGLRYVRFAKLNQSYPNPADRTRTITWRYRIDQSTNVTLVIHTLSGQEVIRLDQGTKGLGVHSIEWTPGLQIASSGVYWARLSTNHGEDWQPFTICE